MIGPQRTSPDPDDTIVALSSAAGPGLRALVRLSGRRSLAIAQQLCPDFRKESGRRFVRVEIALPGLHTPWTADVYFFQGPRTYTGQDVVEIHTWSSPPILDSLVAQCLGAGARAAQPGEFTMRAFLAGKLDLTRAEAVLGVIEAGSRDELKHALTQLAGGVTQPLQTLRDDLLNLLADVEAGLDFSDEDLSFVQTDDLLKRIARGLAFLTNLRRQLEQRALGQRPFRIVLAGKPNAGKSSLFNALAGEKSALVSPQPGTTRDYLERRIDLAGLPLVLVDTAGLRSTSSAIESAAQGLGRQQAEEADLLLWCLERGEADPLHDALDESLKKRTLALATKSDLGPTPAGMLGASATTGAGIDSLWRTLASRAKQAGRAALAPSLSRCRHHIETAQQHLRASHHLALEEQPPELLALELRLALDELGAMAGAVHTDDLLDRVFSRFCVGK